MFRTFSRAVANSTRLPIRTFTTSPSLRRPIDMEQVNTTARLQRLRELMAQQKVDIYSMTSHHSPSMTAD
jgi:hypothetical protein